MNAARSCAKCDLPRYSTSGYCYEHWTQYRLAYAERKRGGPSKQRRRMRHGCTYEPWFKSYEAMRRRCEHPNRHRCYHGIALCPEWRNPRVFGAWAMAHGFRPGLTIDRIDPSKGYSPDNCHWVTLAENVSRSHLTSPVIRDDLGRIVGRMART